MGVDVWVTVGPDPGLDHNPAPDHNIDPDPDPGPDLGVEELGQAAPRRDLAEDSLGIVLGRERRWLRRKLRVGECGAVGTMLQQHLHPLVGVR